MSRAPDPVAMILAAGRGDRLGQRHLPGRNRLRLTHLDCGADASVEVRCAKGHPVPFDELGVELARRSRGHNA